MANSIRISPQMDLKGTNRCPLCQSHINYDQTIHEFSNKVVSRVQLHSQPNTLPRKPLNYAILRLHQEAVWMKLALYENAPQSKIPKGQNAFSSVTIDILIDTGAALSLITSALKTCQPLQNSWPHHKE